MNYKILFILIFLLAAAALTAYFLFPDRLEIVSPAVTSFEECMKAKNPIMENYPRKCKTPDGKNFTEDIGNELEKTNIIRLNSPRPNQIISSPLIITGEARGTWYFEASFPVKLADEKGNELAQVVAQAQSEWMTKDFVPFKAELKFETPSTKNGFLTLEKDNPSGLPENEDKLTIPIRFQ